MIGMNVQTGTGIDSLAQHVSQSIIDIITTPLGSRVMRRNYGSVIPELIDQPLNQATQVRIYAATAAAIMRWEPRIKISAITMDFTAPAGAVVVVKYRLLNQELSTTIPVGNTP